MTVMPSGSNVADKAVSTEDASEMVCLNEVLAALVETKLEAIKAATASKRRWGSVPLTLKKSRLSTSTLSSSQNHYHHHHHHYHHHHHHHEKHKRKKDHKHQKNRERRFDSAPCEKFIADRDNRTHRSGPKSRRRLADVFENRKKRRQSRISSFSTPDDTPVGLGSPMELMSLDGISDLGSLVELDRDQELFDNSEDYPGLHQSAYLSQSDAFLNIDYDYEDYMALDLEEELEELEDSLYYSDIVIRDSPQEQDHPPRRKRKRKQHIGPTNPTEVPEVMLVNRDELPSRAKWTIVATACLLFAMSLILVGVTLRMAPIIDDMGDGRRASVTKKLQNRRPSTAGIQRKNSVRQAKLDNTKKGEKIVIKSPTELEQARKHRRTVFIVLGTFIFLVVASILIVVVTLTNSSFHISPIGNDGLTELEESFHHNDTLRKENEELLNSLNQDTTVPQNSTVPP